MADDTQLKKGMLALIANMKGLEEALSRDVSVGNFDEVTASLRNELARVMKPLTKAIERNGELDAGIAETLGENLDLMLIRKPISNVLVKNFEDLKLPEVMSVSNLSELKPYFEQLAQLIKDTFSIEVPTPQVTVTPQDVIVPEIKIPEIRVPDVVVPESKPIDLTPLLETFESFQKSIEKIAENSKKQQATAFSQGLNESSARKAFKTALNSSGLGQSNSGASGVLALSDATATQLDASNTAIQRVDITVTGGPVSVGFDSSVSAVSGSERGVLLYPASIPYTFQTSKLSNIYVAGANGRRVCFNYFF